MNIVRMYNRFTQKANWSETTKISKKLTLRLPAINNEFYNFSSTFLDTSSEIKSEKERYKTQETKLYVYVSDVAT